jgi:hypothetical protein
MDIPSEVLAKHIAEMDEADLADLIGGYVCADPKGVAAIKKMVATYRGREFVQTYWMSAYAVDFVLSIFDAAMKRDGRHIIDKLQGEGD